MILKSQELHDTGDFNIIEICPKRFQHCIINGNRERGLPLQHNVVIVTYVATESSVRVSGSSSLENVAGRQFHTVAGTLTSVIRFELDLPRQVWSKAWTGPLALQVLLTTVLANGLAIGEGSGQTMVILQNKCSGALLTLKKRSMCWSQSVTVMICELCLKEAMFFCRLYVNGDV